MIDSFQCGLLMGIAIMNTFHSIRDLRTAKRTNDRTGIALTSVAIALGIITLALQILWLLKLTRQ